MECASSNVSLVHTVKMPFSLLQEQQESHVDRHNWLLCCSWQSEGNLNRSLNPAHLTDAAARQAQGYLEPPEKEVKPVVYAISCILFRGSTS